MEKLTDVSTSLATTVSDSWLQQPDPPAERINLMIDPKSKRWAKVHRYFTNALTTETSIEDIIRKSFTHHQYRMLAPAERADVKEMQVANTKRYNALLDGRFKGVQDSLATRLTIMYFGLPAAPVDNPLEEIAKMMGLDEKEVPRYNVRPPLHFLTAHDRRNWGKDSLKSNEAKNYPLPLPRAMEPTLGLRGGGDDNDPMAWSDDYIPEDETPALFSDGWTYLHGLYGRLPFVPQKWRSFSKVLRQLLQAEDHEEKDFSLLWYDVNAYKPQVIHDQLPLKKDSPAVAFLQKHFADSSMSHKDCCVLFADNIHTEINKGPQHWEPIAGNLQSDTVRIGRSLGHAPNGPEEEVVSYAYMAFPKTKTQTFTIGKYGSNQYNAHFTKTLNVLFGAPETSAHHHALFRLVDKNKPKTGWTVPIVYGAMGLPQWVWELLHPRNNPGASWMVQCCWLSAGLEAILMPNYYPSPNPYLISRRLDAAAAPFDQAYRQICEMTAEAFDASVCRKIDSVFLIEGHKEKTTGEFRIEGLQLKPRRDLKSWKMSIPGIPHQDVPTSLGSKLEQSPNFYRTVHVNWRPGHCRLFPGWYSGGDFSVEMPRLTSTVDQFLDAIRELYVLVAPPDFEEEDLKESCFLLTETPSFETLQVQDMDSPSYFIGSDATDDDWHSIRMSITSPIITVSIVKNPKYTNWSTSIDKGNLWGLRLDQEALRQDEMSGGGFRRDALHLQDLDGQSIDTLAGYPADPVPLKTIDPKDDLSHSGRNKTWSPMSRQRAEAFKARPLLKVRNKSVGGPDSLRLPSTLVMQGAVTPDGDPVYDIGILATSQPRFRGFAIRDTEPENHGGFTRGPVEGTKPRRQSMYSLFGDESDDEQAIGEDGGRGNDKDDDGDEKMEEVGLPSLRQENISGDADVMDEDEHDPRLLEKNNLDDMPEKEPENEPEKGPENKSKEAVPPPSAPTSKPARFLQTGNIAGPDDRAHTWSTQPSIFTTEDQRAWPADIEIGFPLTAAPAEKIHRLSGNVPMFSKAVLTPTEQAELQGGFWDLRNMLLKRTNMCPFKGCSYTWRLDQDEELNVHFLTAHAKRKCPFCDNALFGWWDKDQQIKHLGDKHPDEVTSAKNPFATSDVSNPFQTQSTAAPATAPANLIREAFAEEIRSWGPQYKLKEPPRLLTYPLLDWYDNFGSTAVQDPPKKCPIPECAVPHLEHLSSHGVWTHFKNYHTDFKLEACPFCKLSFYEYGEKDKDGVRALIPRRVDECIKHFDCHVYQLWDILEPMVDQRASRTTTRPPGATQIVAGQSTSPQVNQDQPADATQPLKKCAYFEKCGAYVGSMTHKQYRHHIRVNHPKEISTVSSSEEEDEEVDKEDQASDGNDDDSGDDGDDKRDDGDDGQDGGVKTAPIKLRRLKPTPKPTLEPASSKPKRKETSKESQAVDPDEMDTSADTNFTDAESSGSKKSAVVVSKKSGDNKRAAPRAPHTPPPDHDSGTEELSGSSVSRGRRSEKTPKKSKVKAAAKTADPDVGDEEDDKSEGGDDGDDEYADEDGEAGGSGSKSSNTVGRGRSTKKGRRPKGDNDGDYEDEGDEDDDYEEEKGERGRRFRRRAKSPDWVKILGPEDPDFDPDDKMYCSKCLRKAPLRRPKSPNRSPIGRTGEVQAHIDKTRCCRIRNGLGSTKNLPNRSGWIPVSKLPGTLTSIKETFLNRYPTYMRTMYPTHSKDRQASVWRSDPNNPENDEWFNIPWPPYEGLPPFPGEWTAPGLPWDDTPEGRQRRALYIGNRVVDQNYQYQSETDSDDDLKPDVDDIPEFQNELNPLKRSADDGDEPPDEPAPKKAKSSKTAATKTPKAKGTKKPRGGKKAAGASKTPSKTPSKAPSKTPSKAPSKTPSKATSKAPSKTPSKAASKATSKATSKASSKVSSTKTTPSQTPSGPSTRPPSNAGDD
ncbi:hypothetical protein FPOAC1_011343 [Fusarium poae]|uniref:hypothetical protein n=1 Tax=Fusarium poae TaxID=36050 RepID=UPI001CE90405|nr:hypothetical protein FPOAC1_011343 [Fusarium poae]KAG8666534.1 hypothetical protein FPOAC1_011343 [Fusarium poae]